MIAPSPFERLAGCLNGDFGGDPDWFELISVATDEFVATALYRSLIASGTADQAEPEAREYLAELERANTIRNRQLWELARTAVADVNAVGITPTLIKGASEMALLAKPSEYSRLLIDIDLLVSPTDIPAVQAAFEEDGFKAIENSQYGHSPGSYWRPGAVATIDLHNSLPPSIAVLLTEKDLETRLIKQEQDGIHFLVPDDSLRFLINIAHDMLHHSTLASGSTSLRYLLSLIEQVEDPQSGIDWEWLHSKRQNWRFRLAFDLQIAMLEHLFAVTLPVAEPPSQVVRLLHWRRQLKFRNPRLGQIEWTVVRYGLRTSQFIGTRTKLRTRGAGPGS
ncbi:nucleotidyltransferase family protein [Ruegeria halocynthiae]|uniref:nucleotidyltransferase family protein n=1 Tax=Ruegeria halocynthiae TaxID=985054 RepID=UPI00056C948F|nr:nucleotidyltransferase family protein [Ruegeria halocynthiae]